MTPDDNELILSAQRGDMMAFEQLVFRHDKQVLSIAARYVLSAEDAKDIYQEVFLRVYRGIRRFQFKSEFTTWVYRITTNVCLTHKTRQKKSLHVSINDEGNRDGTEDDRHATTDASPEDLTVASEISARVQDAVASLPPKQKLVFTLRHYQGYKLKEIAVMMECTEGTVKRYLFLATQQMRRQLKEVYE
jgi:RNA polymerase sigma-70 factor (ECF subfamily)